MKYEAPEIKIIEIDVEDIIQTSGAGGENETPFNPANPASIESGLDGSY